MVTAGLHSTQALIVACVFLIVIPTLAEWESIDEALIKADWSMDAFEAFHVNENYTIDFRAEMDMVLTNKLYTLLYDTAQSNREKRTALTDLNLRWPYAFVPYMIADSISSRTDDIKAAINHWQAYTCIRFQERELSWWGLKFVFGPSCWSYLGYMGRKQPLVLNSDCVDQATIIHEIGHAIGFVHEHTRPDRDSFLKVNLEGHSSRVLRQFQSYSGQVNNYNVSYDYTSVMHYRAFGIITTLDPAYQDKIGKSPGLSFKDIKKANLMYDCATLRGKCPPKTCPFNGFVFFKEFKERSKCECLCDSGDITTPLVLCSSITKETPGPNTVNVKVIEEPDRCFDLRPNCIYLKQKQMCTIEPTMMMAQCTKTCGFCEKGQELCIDYDSACETIEQYCYDSRMEGTMRNICRKTCKLCTESATPCDILK